MNNSNQNFILKENSIGLPDHLMINPDSGQLDEQLIKSYVLVRNRKHRVTILKYYDKTYFKKYPNHNYSIEKKKSLLNLYAVPSIRFNIYVRAIQIAHKELANGKKTLPPKTYDLPSFELVTFQEYAPEAFTNPSTYKIEFTVANGFHEIAISNSTSENVTIYWRKGMQVACAVKNKILKDLKRWKKVNADEQKLIASALLGSSHLINPDLFNQALKEVPEIANYFSYMISLDQNNPKDVDIHKTNTDIHKILSGIQLNLDILKNNYSNVKAQNSFLEYVEQYKKWNNASSQYNQFVDLFYKWVADLIDVSVIVDIEAISTDGDEQEFKSLLKHWQGHINKTIVALKGDIDFIALFAEIEEKAHALAHEHISISERLKSLKQQKKQDEEVNCILSGLARRKAWISFIQLETEISTTRQELQQKEDEIIQSLLPEGMEIEDLYQPVTLEDFDMIPEHISNLIARISEYTDWRKASHFKKIDRTVRTEAPTLIGEDEEQVEEITETAEANQKETEAVQEPEGEEGHELSTTPKDEEIIKTEADASEIVEAEAAHKKEAQTESANAVKPVTIIENVVEKLESNEIEFDIPEGHSEVGNACLLSMAQELFISGDKINTAITQLVEDDQIPMAAQISYAVTNRKIANKVIPYELLKATYYGMHTFNNRKVFDKSTRLLNNVAPTDIEKLLELPVSGTAPYLMFIACFQPALFGVDSIHPAMLLNSLPKKYFKSGTIDLIDNLWDIAKRGEQVTIDLLLSDGEKSVKSPFDRRRIEDWKDIIFNTQKGYIPIRLAQINSLQNEGGLFKKVTDIMLTNDYKRDNEIQNFIASYKESTDSADLLDKLLNDVDVWHGDGITRIGKQTFHNKLTDLLDIAKDWIEAKPATSRRAQFEDFCRQLNTRLQQVTFEFKAMSEDPNLSWDRKAGAHFVAIRLEYLYKVIRGDIAVWKYPRVKGWYYHPRQIASLYVKHQDDTAPEVIQWLLANIGLNIRSRMHLEMAVEKGYVRLSELLRRYLQDNNKDVPDIDTDAIFTRYKNNINQRCSNIDTQMDNALLTTGLMNPDETEMYQANISEIQEALDHLEILDETKELEGGLDAIEATLKEKTASTKESLIKRLDEGVRELKVSVPDKPLPEGWIEDFHTCLKNSNLPVANEMIDELNYAVKHQQRINRVKVKNIPVLAGFIDHQKKIYDGVKDAIALGRGIDRLIKDEPKAFGLIFKKDTPRLKDAIKSLEHWRTNKPQQRMSKELYSRTVSIIHSIGIKLEFDQYSHKREESLKYRATRGISSMEMMVKHSHSSRPFEIFGTNYKIEKSIPVLVTYKEWSNDSVHDYMKSEGIYGDVILISAVPLQMTQRNEFAKYFKAEERMVLLIDMISLLYLASQEEDQADNTTLRNYLWLAAPFTYFNPYSIGDTAQPTSSSEMVYGRERQIVDLLKMENGRAIVYGGRQLGKSTIMQQVEKRFHDPDRNKYAFYTMLDKDTHSRMEDSEESTHSHEKAKLEIWKFIHSQLIEHKIINSPSAENNTDRLYEESKDAIIAHPKCQFIVIFDEIDPILNIDSKFGFLIMRKLRDMVHQIKGRFKLIIGGLQNVRRFENHSNYPLTQLGGSIQVSIMPAQDALQLVIEPMLAAGYVFENEQTANLILAYTNRHPGLIQIFCYQLIKHLSLNSREPVGQLIVRNADIKATYNNSHVQGLIKNRFKMTLNLDPRYAVIVYSIIYEDMGAKPFTVSSVKEWASIWDSEAFGQLSDQQFEAFLNELEGLGVLTKHQDGRYALRDTNILKLLVDPQKNDVVNELNTALDELANYDPLDRHAYKSKEDRPPSPLSYRDEKSMLGIIGSGAADIHSNIPEETASEIFTTTFIVGSNAQGLNQLELALPALCEEEKLDYEINIYKLYQHSTHEYESAIQFESKLVKPMMDKSKSQGPQLALIKVDVETGIADLLAMIDACNNHSHTSEAPRYPIRLTFILGPAAYWTWIYNHQHTKDRESQQPFIHLGYWRSTAIRYLLEKIHLNDVSTDAVNEAHRITHGWYYKLNEIALEKKAKSNLTSINQFSKYVIPIDTINKKESKQFLNDCGFYDCEWVQPLISEMISLDADQYSKEDVDLCAEEADFDLDSTVTMIKWMTQMGLLVRLPRVENTREGPFYKIAPSVLHAVKRCCFDESE